MNATQWKSPAGINLWRFRQNPLVWPPNFAPVPPTPPPLRSQPAGSFVEQARETVFSEQRGVVLLEDARDIVFADSRSATFPERKRDTTFS